MKIYVSPGPRDHPTLIARREDWEQVLTRLPERRVGNDRARVDALRPLITAALAEQGDVIRLTVTTDDARFLME
jgi:hypothetical protein